MALAGRAIMGRAVRLADVAVAEAGRLRGRIVCRGGNRALAGRAAIEPGILMLSTVATFRDSHVAAKFVIRPHQDNLI